MVLEETSERRVLLMKNVNNEDKDAKTDDVTCYYTDILLGLYLVRGDSMVLLGEVDTDADDEGEANEAFVTAGHNSSATTGIPGATEELTGSGLLMGTSVKEEQEKKHMKRVSLKEFEELEAKIQEQKEEGEDPVHELTWEFDLDLVV